MNNKDKELALTTAIIIMLSATMILSTSTSVTTTAYAQQSASTITTNDTKPAAAIVFPQPKTTVFMVLIKNIPNGTSTLQTSLQVGNNSAIQKSSAVHKFIPFAFVVFNKVPAAKGDKFALDVNGTLTQGVIKNTFIPKILSVDLSKSSNSSSGGGSDKLTLGG